MREAFAIRAPAWRPVLTGLRDAGGGLPARFEIDRMVNLIAALAEADGLTALSPEHDLDVVFGDSDQATVLHLGSEE